MTTKIKSTNTDFGSETDSIVIPKGSTNERTSVVAGSLRFNTTTLALEIYDGTNWSGLASSPNITSISPTNVDSKDSATTTTFTITGSGFAIGTTAKLISNSGTDINFNTVTRDSTTQLTCVLNNALITGDGLTDEPYDIKVTSGNNLSFTLENQINVDQRPVFVTASGSLGTMTEGARATTIYTIEATDPESAGAVRFDVVGGSLPTGATLNSSTGAISGFTGKEVAQRGVTGSFGSRVKIRNRIKRDYCSTAGGGEGMMSGYETVSWILVLIPIIVMVLIILFGIFALSKIIKDNN